MRKKAGTFDLKIKSISRAVCYTRGVRGNRGDRQRQRQRQTQRQRQRERTAAEGGVESGESYV
jgi:hypothetical protein